MAGPWWAKLCVAAEAGSGGCVKLWPQPGKLARLLLLTTAELSSTAWFYCREKKVFTARLHLFQTNPAGLRWEDSRMEVAAPLADGVRSSSGSGWAVVAQAWCLLLPVPSHLLLPWTPQVALCFSPVGSKLRVRSRRFPAIVSCVAIDWFQEWPQEALESVSLRFLREMETVEVSTSPTASWGARAMPRFEFLCGVEALATMTV